MQPRAQSIDATYQEVYDPPLVEYFEDARRHRYAYPAPRTRHNVGQQEHFEDDRVDFLP